VKFGAILDSLKKCVPTITEELVSQVPLAFQIDTDEMVSQQEFEMMFDP
jgi:hypothetical protein